MGEVYLAEDQTLNRRVALKVLPRELAGGERSARFAREAKTLAALNHPNIVTVYCFASTRTKGGTGRATSCRPPLHRPWAAIVHWS
jgi:serine/threonine-protein kinase